MPLTTPLTRTLGVQHPILLAPMDVVAGARLVRAVSGAGGFGILGGGYTAMFPAVPQDQDISADLGCAEVQGITDEIAAVERHPSFAHNRGAFGGRGVYGWKAMRQWKAQYE